MDYRSYCDKAQDALYHEFWDEDNGIFRQRLPHDQETIFCYWWHAHVVDVLLDGYLRTKDEKYLCRIERELEGVFDKNGHTFINNWYDDMEWMALALLRLYDATKKQGYLKVVLELWDDIRTAWNDFQGGGLAWKKDQTDYKNTPANAPAAILAYRLYRRLGRHEDLVWGNRIFDWNKDNLMNEEGDIVYDGKNRLGDGKIDYDWDYTYCQGVMAGAALERYAISGEKQYLEIGFKIALASKQRLCDRFGGVLPYEGKDDCGLFKGIMVRYFAELVRTTPDAEMIRKMICNNARIICEKGMNEVGVIGAYLDRRPEDVVDLAQHLSGMMILEMAYQLKE